MDADTRAKLAEGLTAVVRAAMADPNSWTITIGPRSDRTDAPCPTHRPPLSLTQTLGLRLLLGDTDAGLCAAAVDAMVEAGVVPAETVEMVRQSERERCAAAIAAEVNEFQELGSWNLMVGAKAALAAVRRP